MRVALLCFGVMTFVATGAAVADPLPGAPIVIRSKMHGQLLDVYAANRAEGAPVVSFPQKRSDMSDEEWTLEPTGGRTYFIRSRLTGFVLDISGGNPQAGTPVIAYPQKRGGIANNQLWELVPAGSEFYWIRSRLNGFVLDIGGANRDPGAAVIAYPMSRPPTDNQLWRIDPAPSTMTQIQQPPPPQPLSPPSQPVGDDRGRLMAYDSQMCLAGGGQPSVDDCTRTPPFTIALVPNRSDRVTIRNDQNGQCLFANRDGRFGWFQCGGGGAPGGFGDQQWIMMSVPVPESGAPVGMGQGQYPNDGRMKFRTVRSAHADKCLFSNRDGRFGIYQCNAQYTDQLWRVSHRGLGLPPTHPQAWEDQPTPQQQWQDPPPPPTPQQQWGNPPPRRRDCGTGPSDAGCNETRDGSFAMDAATFSGLLQVINAEPNEIVRGDLTVRGVSNGYVTAQQFMVLLDLFRNELSRVEVTRQVAPRIVDPQRAIGYGAKIQNSFTRRDFLDLLSSQTVTR